MRRTIAALAAAGLLLTACNDADPSDSDGVSAESDSDSGADSDSEADTDAGEADSEAADGDQIEGIAVNVARSEQIGLVAIVDIESDEPVRARVVATSGDHVVTTPATSEPTTTLEIPVVGLRAGLDYDLDVEILGENDADVDAVSASFTTSDLPEWIADHDVTIDPSRTTDGYTIVEFDPALPDDEGPFTQYLVAYDTSGEVVWYYTNSGTLGGVEQTRDGTFLMHYWPFGIREVDMAGRVVAQWRPQPSGTAGETIDDQALIDGVDPDQADLNGTDFEGNPGDAEALPVRADWVDLTSFHHENWPMPNGNILALSTTNHELTAEQQAALCPGDPIDFDIISDVVVEYEPDGTVLRTWDLWDAVDVMEFPGSSMCEDDSLFAEPEHRDWTHANSAMYDPERDAVLISSRHTDQIIAFDHLDTEGPQAQLRWILGAGATIDIDGDLPYHQHAVEVLPDGALVVFDNGNGRPGTDPDDPQNLPYSRAVVYDVDDSSSDPSEWSASQRWEYRAEFDDGTPVYTDFIGDADVLDNGNVLITFGGIGSFPPSPEDPLSALIVEVVPSGTSGGDVAMQITSKAGQPNTAYRSEQISSFYVGDAWSTAG
ncbi:MAG TPA: aryl-sulfate sulfotransferase [Ilumatobacteraceae bacterium]|nr:aryl-sulfate sulfotransferase [Ilumatobacteraceae bacterium]